MKKITLIVSGVIALIAIFGIGVFRFKLAVNDRSIDVNIGNASSSKGIISAR